MNTQAIQNNYLQTREIVKEQQLTPNYFTTAKVQRYASYALAGLFIGTGIAIAAFSIATVIPWPLAFVSIPLFVLGGVCIYYLARPIKDFDDPVELAALRAHALTLNLFALEKEYEGYEGLATVIKKHVLSVQDARYKLMECLMVTHSLSDFLRAFEFKNISLYSGLGILKMEEASLFRDLLSKDAQLDNQRYRDYQQIDLQYAGRLERKLKELEEEEARAIQEHQRMQDQVQDIGNTLTTGAVYGLKHNRNDHSAQFRTWVQGQTLTDVATIGTSLLTQHTLDRKLRKIEEKRKIYQADPEMLAQQSAYNEKARQIELAYSSSYADLSREFQTVRNQLIESLQFP
jgi:hypothetical protein